MPCIFCDQTPETATAVETLASIKRWLQLLPDVSNEVIKDRVAQLAHNLHRSEMAAERLRSNYDSVCEDNRRLREDYARRGACQEIRRSEADWAHMQVTPAYIMKPNGKAGRWNTDIAPYNAGKSKKERFA